MFMGAGNGSASNTSNPWGQANDDLIYGGGVTQQQPFSVPMYSQNPVSSGFQPMQEEDDGFDIFNAAPP